LSPSCRDDTVNPDDVRTHVPESRAQFGWLPLLVVSVAVVLNILSAVTLKSIADLQHASMWLLLGALGVVTLLNGLRFLIWGVAHKRYPLSLSYPLSSMFFPLMLGVAYLYGEPIKTNQVAGTVLITVGVLWMAFNVEKRMSGFKATLARRPVLKRNVNHAYAYVNHLVHLLLNLMPWFIRNLGFRLMMGRAGLHMFIDHDVYMKFPWLVEVGDGASINRGASFYPSFFGDHKIVLGNNVRIAPGVRLHAASHDITDLNYTDSGGPITVGDDVWIGASAIILPGVTIGARSVVGAGSVVTRDLPPDSVAVGSPAKVVRRRIGL